MKLKLIVLLFFCCFCFFGLASSYKKAKETRVIADKNVKFRILNNGNYEIKIITKYFYGDIVKFNSKLNGEGEGHILDIVIQENGIITYHIWQKSDNIQGGITEDEITLLKKFGK